MVRSLLLAIAAAATLASMSAAAAGEPTCPADGARPSQAGHATGGLASGLTPQGPPSQVDPDDGGLASGLTPRDTPPQVERAAALIRSYADLDAYLGGAKPPHDPLAALSSPARSRFLASLRFGPNGLVSFQSADLQAELSAAQACALLALFGLQSALAAMPPLPVRSPADAGVEGWRRARTPRDEAAKE